MKTTCASRDEMTQSLPFPGSDSGMEPGNPAFDCPSLPVFGRTPSHFAVAGAGFENNVDSTSRLEDLKDFILSITPPKIEIAKDFQTWEAALEQQQPQLAHQFPEPGTYTTAQDQTFERTQSSAAMQSRHLTRTACISTASLPDIWSGTDLRPVTSGMSGGYNYSSGAVILAKSQATWYPATTNLHGRQLPPHFFAYSAIPSTVQTQKSRSNTPHEPSSRAGSPVLPSYATRIPADAQACSQPPSRTESPVLYSRSGTPAYTHQTGVTPRTPSPIPNLISDSMSPPMSPVSKQQCDLTTRTTSPLNLDHLVGRQQMACMKQRAASELPTLVDIDPQIRKFWQSNTPLAVVMGSSTSNTRRQRKRKRAPSDKAPPRPRKYVKPNAACNQDLIRRVRECQRRLKMSQVDIMRASGLSNTVLCDWLQSRYRGNVERVNQKLERWISDMNAFKCHEELPIFLRSPQNTRPKFDETVVDITLNMELRNGNGWLRETLKWDISEHRLNTKDFAIQMCKDRRIPVEPNAKLVSDEIHSQLQTRSAARVGSSSRCRGLRV